MWSFKLEPMPIRHVCAGIALALSTLAAAAQSSGELGGGLRFSGFGTFGVVHSKGPEDWGYLRSINQHDHGAGTRVDTDSRLGVQANYSPNNQFELVGQLVAARSVVPSDALEWGFAAFRPNTELTLRVGRLNIDQYLMSEYRNVGFGYMFARPPIEFYSVQPTSLDGADISRSRNIDGVQWRAKAFVGRAHSNNVRISPVLGAMISREAGGLLLRAALTHTRVENAAIQALPLIEGLNGLAALPVPEVAAQALELRKRLDLAGARVTYATLGLNYDQREWQWTAELSRSSGHPAVHFETAYAGVGRRFGALTVFGLVSRIRTPEPYIAAPAWMATLEPMLGLELAQQAQLLGDSAAYAANRTYANQNTYSLGTRWDFHPQRALKVQWDHVRVQANGSMLWSNGTLNAGRGNVASVSLDFVF